MTSGKRPELSGQGALRGIAALTVFLANGEFFHEFPEFPWLKAHYPIFYWHGVAVDLFFMLSGFILYYVYSARKFAWYDYGLARFARIYPLYFTGMVSMLGMSLYAFTKTGHLTSQCNPATVLASLFLVQDWPFLPHFIDREAINPPTWSISVEVFLYIFIFPALFYLNKRLSVSQKWVLLILPVLAQAIIYRFFELSVPHPRLADFFSPFRGILSFTSGFFVCSLGLGNNFAARLLPKAVEVIFLLVVVSSLLFSFPIDRACWIILVFPALIYLAADNRSMLTRALSGGVFHWLGDISYSIYVWHWPVIKFMGVASGIRRLGTMQPAGYSSLTHRSFFVMGTIVAVLLVAHCSHYYFEMPLNRWIKRRFKKTSLPLADGPVLSVAEKKREDKPIPGF